MKHSYEVEIKSLLGTKERASKLKADFLKAYPKAKLLAEEKQLNHYFNLPSDMAKLESKISPLVPADKQELFKNVLEHGKKMSIRTRQSNDKVILVIKASVGDDTSSNGVKRIEFEQVVKQSLTGLDNLLLSGGCTYQAKWSREREEYGNDNIHLCIDKNAGYGYLAEFEKVTDDEKLLETVRRELLAIMAKLEADELPQDRLERMFAHYNAHWSEYYGTEKTFNIK
ncbi:MAG: CYTH domain-containing protein [Candidatus Paceibacterota bacterium]